MPQKSRRRRVLRILAGIGAALGVVLIGLAFFINWAMRTDPFVALFDENCSVCHGEELGGTPLGTPLIVVDLVHGESVAQIHQSIANGFPQRGMPAWRDALSTAQIQSLAIYISERRVDRRFTDFKVDTPLTIPQLEGSRRSRSTMVATECVM